jgi:hypothetical protein
MKKIIHKNSIKQSDNLIEDKIEALKIVKASGKDISRISHKLRDDEEIVFKASQNDYIALQYASARLRGSREFIDKIIDKARYNFSKLLINIPNEFKNDKKLMLKLITKEKEGKVISYLSDELKNDYDVVSETVKINGVCIIYASENCKNNKEIALLAVKNKGYALEFIFENLKNNKEVVMAAVKNYGEALKYASENLRDNKEVVLAAVSHNGNALKYASDNLKNDLEIALAAYHSVKGSTQFFSKEIKKRIGGQKNIAQYLESLNLKENLDSEMTSQNIVIKRPKI